ncbi:hypothetical protein M407DRAFT_76396 [Tulasnella calospora MUT 4182]|uniref:Protein kinase domain-containing protein n=1 Tax=Tulasnella calospora MUT 4182 TaxID=1051891 RepID=A0A0C3KTT4_9AGAM|nr:hypothetical protein M407DRAFT_76396 [Tulasnella calospora MUT 4182]
MLKEAEFLVKISHPNIIPLNGFVEDVSKNMIWLVFPWEANGSLSDFIASGNWEIPERISLINDVAEGVKYLHSRKPAICHGDLKSANVLVNSENRAVIIDFGSAGLVFNVTFCASTMTISLTGNNYTLRWAAPEVLKWDEAGLQSDIWALGWVAFEVMTSSIPFQGVPDITVFKRVIQGDLPSITADTRMFLIQALGSLIFKCLTTDPSKRPTAEEYQQSINWMVSNAGLQSFARN